MRVVITLNFAGRTEEALAFYLAALDAQTLFLMRFRDGPEPWRSQPGVADKIFHATFRLGDMVLMASDVTGTPAPAFSGFALDVTADSVSAAERMFEALSDGGTIQIPLAPSAFKTRYGIVTDRFGLSWKISVE